MVSALDSLPTNATIIWLLNRSSNPLRLQEGLDLALALSVMGQAIVLLCDESALAMFRPDYQAPGVRDLSKNVKALSLYGIEHIFAYKATANGEHPEDLPESIHLLTNQQVQRLIAQSQRTFTF